VATPGRQERAEGPQAFVINLVRSYERREHMMVQLAKTNVPWEIVDAVDGRDLDIADTNLVSPELSSSASLRPGAVGCAMSHLQLYHRVMELGLPEILVLEDDIILPADLGSLASAAAREMSGAEIVLLNYHPAGPLPMSRLSVTELPGGRLLAYPADLSGLTSGGAYLVTIEACRRLAANLMPLRCYSDDWHHFVVTGCLDRVRCVLPMPVTNSRDLRTSIDYYSQHGLQGRARDRLNKSRLGSRLLVWRRRWSRRDWVVDVRMVDDYPADGMGGFA
jgi:glycosyl transferase family 25